MFLIRHLITGNKIHAPLNVLLFIAKRIIGKRGKGGKISRPTVNIAITGVAIGIAVMIIDSCYCGGLPDIHPQ